MFVRLLADTRNHHEIIVIFCGDFVSQLISERTYEITKIWFVRYIDRWWTPNEMSASRKIAFSVVGLQLMFDDPFVRRVCEILFKRAFEKYKIFCRKMTFDSDHMHMIMVMGLYSKPEL